MQAPAPPRPSRRASSRHVRAGMVAALLAVVAAAGLKVGGPAQAAAAPLTRSPDGRPLKLTFADEFDSFRPWVDGKGVWRTTLRDGRGELDDEFNVRTLRWNKERQLYVDAGLRGHVGPHSDEGKPDGGVRRDGRPLGLNPFEVRGGMLDIVAKPTPAGMADQLGGFRYISGVITTQPTFNQTYGYFEMRAKLPRGKGIWPAFWLLPQDLSWPPEIDIMESIGDPSKVYVTPHSGVAKLDGQELRVSPDDFHVYAVAWDPKDLIWFIDGKEVRRTPTPADMSKPMYILANLAVGGSWPGDPDASTTFPQAMSIDYIRAYRFAQ